LRTPGAWLLGLGAGQAAAATWRSVCSALGDLAACLYARQTKRICGAWAECQCGGQTKRTSGVWVDYYVRNIINKIINKFKRKYYCYY